MFAVKKLANVGTISRYCGCILQANRVCPNGIVVPTAGKRWTAEDCEPPPSFDDQASREGEKNILPIRPKVPVLSQADLKDPNFLRREDRIYRGPCLGEEAELKYKQYGITALKGGLLKAGHFDMIRLTVNRNIRNKPYIFAEYRVPAVWKPVTRHPLNAVMGGGKGNISYYVTPVKARQVIVEVGGKASFQEVYKFMKIIAHTLPVPAMAVTHEMLQAMYEEERRIEDENENFITFREVAEKNMLGMRSYLTKYDLKYFGKYK